MRVFFGISILFFSTALFGSEGGDSKALVPLTATCKKILELRESVLPWRRGRSMKLVQVEMEARISERFKHVVSLDYLLLQKMRRLYDFETPWTSEELDFLRFVAEYHYYDTFRAGAVELLKMPLNEEMIRQRTEDAELERLVEREKEHRQKSLFAPSLAFWGGEPEAIRRKKVHAVAAKALYGFTESERKDLVKIAKHDESTTVRNIAKKLLEEPLAAWYHYGFTHGYDVYDLSHDFQHKYPWYGDFFLREMEFKQGHLSRQELAALWYVVHNSKDEDVLMRAARAKNILEEDRMRKLQRGESLDESPYR